MCVIMIKKRGVDFPPVKEIQNCADSNKDGFSMMFNTADGNVTVYKTMSKAKFINMYKKISSELNPRLTAMVIHCRISTHGSNNVKNCHCWTTSDRQIGFAHNGILHSIGNVKDMTDSETFFRYLFEPVYAAGGWSSAELLIKGVIGTSKFAFLLGTGEVRQYGNFQKSAESGCEYSNGSYMSWSQKTVSYGGGCYGGGYGGGGYNGASFPEYRYYTDEWD